MFIVFQFKLPVWGWLALWFGLQVLGAWADPTGRFTGVAYVAHITGLLAGLLAIFPFQKTLTDRHPLLHLLRKDRLVEAEE